jgi:hypothetical protein
MLNPPSRSQRLLAYTAAFTFITGFYYIAQIEKNQQKILVQNEQEFFRNNRSFDYVRSPSNKPSFVPL